MMQMPGHPSLCAGKTATLTPCSPLGTCALSDLKYAHSHTTAFPVCPPSLQEWGVDLSQHQQPNPATKAYVDWVHAIAQDPKQVNCKLLAVPIFYYWI